MEHRTTTDDFRPTREDLRAALDATVFQVLLPGALGLTALYVMFGTAHWLLLPAPAKRPMTLIAYSSAVLLFVFALLVRRRPWPVRWAHPAMVGIAWIVLANSLAHIYFTAAPRQTMNLVLLVFGLGCTFLSIRWFVFMLGSVFAGWWATALLLARPGSIVAYYDFELCSVTVLAIIIFALRRRAYIRLELLRLKEEQLNAELKAALQSAEREISERKRVEADLEQARAELERRVEERTQALATANDALRKEITERTRIEAALRKSEGHLVLAQMVGHIGSWDLDLRASTLHWSAETYRIFGLDPSEGLLTRERFYATVHPADRVAVRNAFAQALREGTIYAVDHRIVRPDGSERFVCEKAEFVRDASGNPVQVVGTVQDITDRKLLEDQLRHAQKLDAIGQLAAGIAHDFNNTLTVIQGHTTLLHEATRDDPERRALLDEIVQAADRAARLTRQLLLFSRKEVLQMRELDLNEVIGNLSSALSRMLGEPISLRFDGADHLPAIEADATMLEQVLINLAVNARDAMPQGGQLRISTAVESVDPVRCETNPEARPGPFVRLTVADTGCGIESALLPRIFEPFFTTKPVGKGTGLGLSTVYGIVKQHRGWIEVASEVGRGTRFHVFFPVSASGRRPATVKPPPAEVRGGTECILVVEDEAAVRRLNCRLLRRHGYEVLEAESGLAGLAVWEEHWERIDLLLTDLVMPGSLSGRDLAEQCRTRKPALKIIFTSGYSADLVALKAVLKDGTYFLPKPYPLSTLALFIRNCLDASCQANEKGTSGR